MPLLIGNGNQQPAKKEAMHTWASIWQTGSQWKLAQTLFELFRNQDVSTLNKNFMAIQVGQAAPDFTLFNSDRQQITLSEHRGKNVLLLFFPLAFTSVCTAELCSVRDNLHLYESLNATPFGISVDSMATLKKFKEDQGLNFTLLSDFNKEVAKAYEVIYEQWSYGMKGVSKRAAFVIDKEGIVQYAEVLENAGEQPNFSAIKEKLASLTA